MQKHLNNKTEAPEPQFGSVTLSVDTFLPNLLAKQGEESELETVLQELRD